MKTLRVAFAALGCLLTGSIPAFSQLAAPGPELAASVERARQQYAGSFVGNSQLYNGIEYVDYSKRYHTRQGHRFFASPEQQAGSVDYNGRAFTGLQLNYDVVLDQVLLSPPNSPLLLRLVDERVRGFSLGTHHFVRLLADSTASSGVQTGYYEVLFAGTVQVLAKRAKRMQERLEQNNLNVQFTAADRLFLKKAGAYYPVNRKSAVLRVFADHGKEVQAYLKANKLSFKKDQFEPSVVALAGYYNGLPAH